MRLDGKVALVTGGASGIGAATAALFVREGARVVISDIAVDQGGAVAASLGPNALFLEHDVTQEAAWQQAVADTLARFGALHVLVNNAGLGAAADIESCSFRKWRRVQDANATSVFLGCKHGVPAMKHRGGASIVNISSVLGLRAMASTPAYCAAKGAVRLLTKSVAYYCARHRLEIRCNSVHPGYIETPMIAGRLERPAGNQGETVRDWLEALHPLGRLGRAEEIAAMILFLASDESSFATGAEFTVDGGLTA